MKPLTASGSVEYSCRINEKILLLVARFAAQDFRSIEVFHSEAEQITPLEFEIFSHRQEVERGDQELTGKKVLLVKIPENSGIYPLNGNLIIKTDLEKLVLDSDSRLYMDTDLQTLLRENFTGLNPELRANLTIFLTSALSKFQGDKKGIRFSKTLFTIREALRERFPAAVNEPDQESGLNIERILALNENSFYIKGWAYDCDNEIKRLTVVSPEGSRIELINQALLYPRSDILQFYKLPAENFSKMKNGFISYFELKEPSYLRNGWIVEMQNGGGSIFEAAAPPLVAEYLPAREFILRDIELEKYEQEKLMLDHIHPALQKLQEYHSESIEIERVEQFGVPAESARVSIIVPLYQRIDLLEQQLAQFADDEEIRNSDLIYVLDSPEQSENLREIAEHLTNLYAIAFRIVILSGSGGFSIANNLGASVARARLLLLLNSDVLPARKGWLGRLIDSYDSTPEIGALAPKLLFEDDAIQHAGIYFEKLSDCHEWEIRHFFKGFHSTLAEANAHRRVPAVTGACLMISADLYQKAGGLREIFVQGGYEDSDLCLRLMEKGYENWYLPEVVLYHLESQSYRSSARQLNMRFNRWLHTRLWNRQLERLTNNQ